jgi:pilus assembly protein CpaF
LRGINPPSWREADPEKRRRFFDEVRSILIDQGEDRIAVNRNAQIITMPYPCWLARSTLRDPYVEEIFVRTGVVAVEYDGSFYHLGKQADDRYFENLAVHVADQGGATLRGDRPAVLIDLPGGERFTAIVPRLSTEGTAINIRTFGRRVRTLEEMEQTGTFTKINPSDLEVVQTFATNSEKSAGSESSRRFQSCKNTPDRFLAWMVSTLAAA